MCPLNETRQPLSFPDKGGAFASGSGAVFVALGAAAVTLLLVACGGELLDGGVPGSPAPAVRAEPTPLPKASETPTPTGIVQTARLHETPSPSVTPVTPAPTPARSEPSAANRLRHARSETDFVCDRHGQAADSKSGCSSNGHINLDADIDATGDADFGTHGVGDGPTPDAVSHSQRDIDVDCDAVAHTDAFSHTHRAISHTNTASDADRHPDGDRHP